jgi:hypothetical protein
MQLCMQPKAREIRKRRWRLELESRMREIRQSGSEGGVVSSLLLLWQRFSASWVLRLGEIRTSHATDFPNAR